MSISGDLIAVGATAEDSIATTVDNTDGSASADDSKFSSGAVYVFKKTGTDWVQDAYLKASISEADDCFGEVVSIDNDFIVVGSIYEVSNWEFSNPPVEKYVSHFFQFNDKLNTSDNSMSNEK